MNLEEFKEAVKNKNFADSIEHYQDGNVSMWTFTTDTMKIHTGDGGAMLILEAIEKESKKVP